MLGEVLVKQGLGGCTHSSHHGRRGWGNAWRLIACTHVGDRFADVYEQIDDPGDERYAVYGPTYYWSEDGSNTGSDDYVGGSDDRYTDRLDEALMMMNEAIQR